MSALEFAFALSLPAALAPHVIPLGRAAPVTGAVVWMLALLLRALVVVGVGTFAFARLAHTDVVEAALNWCWHEVLPDLPGWLGFAEDPVAHAVVAVPIVAIAMALLVHAADALRAWAGLRRRLSSVALAGLDAATVIPDR